MINNLQISGVRVKLNDDLRTYVQKKIGGLDKYLPKRARESTFVEVKLKENTLKARHTYECEVIMKLPKGNITAHEESTTELAAIDEVENNLKNQLKRYKDLHSPSRMGRHLSAKMRQSPVPEGL